MKNSTTITALFLCALLLIASCNTNQEKTLTPEQRYAMAHRIDSLMQDSINKVQAARKPKAVLLPKVQIGTQVWATKNLHVTTFRNGDPIPEFENQVDFTGAGDNGQPAWCYYKGDKTYAKYGKYYNWWAVHDGRGLAPEGWHIPNDAEWLTLANYLGREIAGGKMKSKDQWNGDNSSGFDALPAGYSNGNAGDDLGKFAMFWSTTEFPNQPDQGSVRQLGSDNPHFDQSWNSENKTTGNSVRCLQN
jgi:uncharacterized protein (TIGR02145 family)